MIYMQTYWSKVDHDAEPGLAGRYPLVPGVFIRKDGPTTLDWDSCQEFERNRGGAHDHVGNLFGGVLFALTSKPWGIRTYQLIKDDNDFMEVIHAPWLNGHADAVNEAWHERDRTRYQHRCDVEDVVLSDKYAAANNRWVALRMLKEEQLEKMYE